MMSTVFLVLALIAALLATFNVSLPRVSLVPLALVFYFIAVLVGHVPLR